MRHRKAGIKIGRTTSHRDAMFRNMVTSLLKHDRIRTTNTKAKELRRWADHIITLAKRGDLHARRMALSIVREKDVVHKLFETAGDRFGEISGGYTRVVKIGRRPGDSAPMSIIELVGPESATKKKKKKKSQAAKAAAPAAVAADTAEEASDELETAEASAAADDAAEEPAAEEAVEAQASDAVEEKASETEEASAPEADAAPEPAPEQDETPVSDEKKGSS